MHSTIYLLSVGTKDDLFFPSPDWIFDEEMSAYADYVQESNFKDDVKWLQEEGVKLVKEKGTNLDGEEVVVYRITDAKEFIKKITEQTLEEVKKQYTAVEKEPTSTNMYYLSRAARPTDEFHFICFGKIDEKYGYSEHYVNSYEFAEFLKENPDAVLYVYATFDYHS